MTAGRVTTALLAAATAAALGVSLHGGKGKPSRTTSTPRPPLGWLHLGVHARPQRPLPLPRQPGGNTSAQPQGPHTRPTLGAGALPLPAGVPASTTPASTPAPAGAPPPNASIPAAPFGVLPRDTCFRDTLPVPETLRRLEQTYYKPYIDFGRRWHALPVCPAKAPVWSRSSERYRPAGGAAGVGVGSAGGGGGVGGGVPKVTLCASLVANEEAFLVEWVYYHLLLGVHSISIYPSNTAQHLKLRRVKADANISDDVLYIHPTEVDWGDAYIEAGGNHVSLEKRYIAHCFRDRLNDTDVVLHIDVDEFLFPGTYPDIPTLFAAELQKGRDEIAFCVRYLGYGAAAPVDFSSGGGGGGTQVQSVLARTTHTGNFCSNSKAAGLSRCVKKPKKKVRFHAVHQLPLCCGCKGDPLVGTYLKKVAPSPCCRPSYFVAHMQQRDFELDFARRRREVSKRGEALQVYKDWHAMASVPDTRFQPYGEAVLSAIRMGCFTSSSPGRQCPVPLPPVQPPV